MLNVFLWLGARLRIVVAVLFVFGGCSFGVQADDLLRSNQVRTDSKFESATECRSCHSSQYTQWRSSMMGYSSKSPPIHALELSENHTNRGSFGRLLRTPGQPDANGVKIENRLFCQKCHAPVAVFTDLFRLSPNTAANYSRDSDNNIVRLDDNGNESGTNVDSHTFLESLAAGNITGASALDISNAKTAVEGVTCTVCHRINGIDDNSGPFASTFRPSFEAGVANSGYRINHFKSNEQPTNYGPFFNPFDSINDQFFPSADRGLSVDPCISSPNGGSTCDLGHLAQTTYASGNGGPVAFPGEDGVVRPFIQTGEFCGTCHDVRIPMADALAENPDGSAQQFQRVENLFSEWRNSPWNNNDNVPNLGGVPDTVINGGLVSVLDNPAGPVMDDIGNLSSIDTSDPENPLHIKNVTTCQDCHMSKYMTEVDAKPGEYEMGNIAGGLSAEPRKISNHRFIGVDRFLVDADARGDMSDILESNSNAGTPMDSLFNDFKGLDFKNGKADAREILLQKAVDFKIISAVEESGYLNVDISVENVGAGHNIPAGLSQERQVWIELEVLDGAGQHVYTSGYLSPIEEHYNENTESFVATQNDPEGLFEPYGNFRYKDTYCGKLKGDLEYKCDLDAFRAKLENNLAIAKNSSGDDIFEEGADARKSNNGKITGLVNYQNGFTLGGQKVFSQFIGDAIDNGNALKPFEKEIETYNVNTAGHTGPFKVSARLRFRPLPHEFLAALKQNDESFKSSRVTDDVIKRNKVIEMEQDACVTGAIPSESYRPCEPRTVLALGGEHSCAVMDDQTVKCWGRNVNQQLGRAGRDDGFARIVSGVNSALMVSAGTSHSCALRVNGKVQCWGGIFPATPTEINGLSNATHISSGDDHICAITDDGSVKCWGRGDRGVLGDGDTSSHNQILFATSVNGLSGVVELASGGDNTCAIIESGEVYCWGDGRSGILGDGSAPLSSSNTGTPVKVLGLEYRAKAIDLGGIHACAALVNDEVYCWGDGSVGRLGSGASSKVLRPVKVEGLVQGVSMLSLGNNTSCALMEDETVSCWGSGGDDFGALGDGISFFHTVNLPQSVQGLSGVKSIVSGAVHTCAVSDDKTLKCWGHGLYGRLGDLNITDHDVTSPLNISYLSFNIVAKSLVPDVVYPARFDDGGPGQDGCVDVNGTPTNSCDDKSWGVDLNSGAGFQWVNVDGGVEGGSAALYLTVSAFSGTRSMSVWVNGVEVGMISTTPAESPRPTGKEFLFDVELNAGNNNVVRLMDTEGTLELDVYSARVVAQ